MNIATRLSQQAKIQPDALALLDSRHGIAIRFGELDAEASRWAAWLQSLGLAAGDIALVLQPLSISLYVLLLALFKLGMVAMVVDPGAGRQHLDRCCQIASPHLLIASPKAHLLRVTAAALRRIPRKITTGGWVPGAWSGAIARSYPALAPIAPCTAESPALLTFTSGSTGQPKAALRSHGLLLAQHQALAQALQLQSGQVDLTTLPIFVLANLASGVTSLFADADLRYPGRVDPARLLRQIRAYTPQTTVASPALLDRLATYCEVTGQSLPSFQRIFTGGAPVFPVLLHRLQRLAPQAEVTVVYGSTEAEPIAHLAYTQITRQDWDVLNQGGGLPVGSPVAEIQLKILRQVWGQPIPAQTAEDFQRLQVPLGEAGEIVVSGDHVLPGYLHGQGDRETKFSVDGVPWHRTGDAGYLDSQGRLWLLGRCSAGIQDEMGTLYPFAVEAIAQSISMVRRVALVSHQGVRTLVIEWMRSSSSAQRAIALAELQVRLAWAGIQQYGICAQIPVDRRHNAKIDYPALAKILNQLHPSAFQPWAEVGVSFLGQSEPGGS